MGGYGSDSHFDGDGLSLEEIREALDHSVMADKAFDFVAFDACLMGSVEIADCLEGRAGYVIASPELPSLLGRVLVPLPAWYRMPKSSAASIWRSTGDLPVFLV